MSASKLEKNIANLERRMREEFKAELATALKAQSRRLDAFEVQLQRLSGLALKQDAKFNQEELLISDETTMNRMPQAENLAVVPVVRQAWTQEVEEVKATPSPEEPEEPMEPVAFLETPWNLVLVLGFADAGWMDIVIGCSMFILSAATQAFFSAILLTKEFQGDPFSAQIDIANAWRRSVAHDAVHMDLAQTSLISRVCNDDGALILSTEQASLVKQINSFMGYGKPGDFDRETASGMGILLAMLCILLWCLYICNEFRTIWLSLEAVVQLPRARRTTFHDGRFTTMSWPRLGTYIFLRLLRAAIGGTLLYAGILWLGGTTSISDLIVNAVALGAVLNVDEMMFAAAMPKKLQIRIQDLEAIKIKYSRRRSQVEAMLILLLMGGIMVWSYFTVIDPLARDMEEVKRAYCAGNQDFVVTLNAEQQLTVGLATIPHGNVSGKTLTQHAVELYIHQDTSEQPKYIHFQSDQQRFEAKVLQSMSESAEGFPYCKDLDEWYIYGRIGVWETEFVDIFRAHFWSASLVLNEPPNSTCAEMAHRCQDPQARSLRLVCGRTCGCGDPRSFPYYKAHRFGCSAACLREAAAPAEPVCTDTEDEALWSDTWDAYPRVLAGEMRTELSASSPLGMWVGTIVTEMKSWKCPLLADERFQKEPVLQTYWCEGVDWLFAPMARLCPESCGCTNATWAPYRSKSCNAECHPSCIDAGLPAPINNVTTCAEGKAGGLCTTHESFGWMCIRTCNFCQLLLESWQDDE